MEISNFQINRPVGLVVLIVIVRKVWGEDFGNRRYYNKMGEIPLSEFPYGTTSKLDDMFSTLSL